MIDTVLNKTGNLNIDLKGNTDKDLANKISLKKYLEHFLVAPHITRASIIIIFNSRITNYFSFTFNMGGGQRAQGNQAQNGSNMIYFLILIFVIYIFPLFFSKQQSLFSTSATNTYRFPMKTSTFQAPYYVRE